MAQVKPLPLRAEAPEKKYGDKFVVYVAAITIVVSLIGFAGSWYFLKAQRDVPVPEAAFLDTGRISAGFDGYAIAARMSVQTSKADIGWADRNKKAITTVLHTKLASSDPTKMLTPQDLNVVQSELKDAVNLAFGSDKVDNVFFTEFLIRRQD